MTLIKNNFLLLLILFLGISFRLMGLSWDNGFNLHPDERAIIMATLPLELPDSLYDLLSPQSPLNPHFFAYGNAPIYVLKVASFFAGLIDATYTSYEKIALVGRSISVFLELLTIILLAKLGEKVFNKKIGTIAAFLYGCSTLAIQISHFYTVDTPLTTIVTATLLTLIYFYEKPTIQKALLIGFLIGLGLATKNSALVLLSAVGVSLVVDFITIVIKKPYHPRSWHHHIPNFLQRLFIYGVIIVCMIPIIFFMFEPYALISFPEFWMQTLQQYAMTHNAFTFPYTLQYVGKISYIYELKNIFLWGQGPFIASITFCGALFVTYQAVCKEKKDLWAHELILVSFFWVYFAIVGNFAIGFMRYLLPIYPLLCLFGAVFLYTVFTAKKYKEIIVLFFIVGSISWPLSFLNIYTDFNTRLKATGWIHSYIPPGSTLAIEHWDDGLPLTQQSNYQIQTLELYQPDSEQKWQKINTQLHNSDYIVIASNRLYIPLQKLTNCEVLPSHFCYTMSAQYYKKLFNEELNFRKVGEFTQYPKIPFTNISIIDDTADESFTVYDHPKVIIYKKIK